MPPTVENLDRSQSAAGEADSRVRFSERLHFLFQFARNPRVTGAIAPSSIHLAEAMVADMDLEFADHVVELGAGTGVFTSVIADCLHEAARFTVMEINPRLAASLQRTFDDTVDVVCGSAADLCRHLDDDDGGSVDAIVSGLPWVTFDACMQKNILLEIHRALRPGGKFCTFAYAHAAWLPSGQKFRGKLELIFRKTEVLPIVWRNLPPAFIYRCEK
jgi:phospholipid N-methyltransferase